MSNFVQSVQDRLALLCRDYSEGKPITHVNLSNCELTEFPLELLRYKDTLELINFGGNKLSSLPSEIVEFQKLKILFFAENCFTSIPVELGKLPNLYMLSFKNNKVSTIEPTSLSSSLKWLILTDNKIKELPAEIGKLTKLRKFMLAGNELEYLPDEMSNCRDLELFRISVNKLTVLPKWLLELPKLSWIALSGNAFPKTATETKTSNGSANILWKDITMEEKIGEGASGFVYRGSLSDGAEVAIKQFKGLITSDGLAEDEIEVTKRVGDHPQFLKMIGQVVEHPENKLAILLPLLNTTEYTVVGNPPSFDSITRDTFPSSCVLSLDYIVLLLKGICSACVHLHQCGILHGDLYAHNILAKQNGHVLLTDFGAASLVGDVFDEATVSKLEKIEVRAFGCLMEDLLQQVDQNTVESDIRIQPLLSLKEQCMVEIVENRPRFSDVESTLLSIL